MRSAVDQDAERDAAGILADVWREAREQTPLPVDPVAIARAFAIDVAQTELAAGVAGTLVKEPGRDPKITVHRPDTLQRKCFTTAYALGQFLLRSDGLDEYHHVDRRDIFVPASGPFSRRYCFEFAQALLIPEPDLRRLLDEGYDEFRLVRAFDVLRESMHFRLASLGLGSRR